MIDTPCVELLFESKGSPCSRRQICVLPTRPLPRTISLTSTTRTDPNSSSLKCARNRLPPEVAWTAFGIGRAAFPMLGQAYILGGNVRVGMEDTVYVERGRLTSSNAELVKKASWLITKLGGEIATSEEARDMLELRG